MAQVRPESIALRFRADKRVRSCDDLMAQTTTARLIEHLEQSGFLTKRKPPIEGSAIRRRDGLEPSRRSSSRARAVDWRRLRRACIRFGPQVVLAGSKQALLNLSV